MNSPVVIDSDHNFIILRGFASVVEKNQRLQISFARLNFQIQNEDVYIPATQTEQISAIQKIEKILSKVGIGLFLSASPNKEISNFEQEKQNFIIFAEQAKNIRDDNFGLVPELISQFDNFRLFIQENIDRKLYPLQLLSAFHLAFSQNACNFSVPGSGKTTIVYSAFSYLNSLPSNDQRHVDNLLVIGPLSSFAPWEIEYEACFTKSANSFRMSGDDGVNKDIKLQHLFSPKPALLTLMFHGAVDTYQNEIIDFLRRNKTMVVVDEAHKIKNPEGIWGRSVVEISKNAKARVILTGTPLPNGYQDIFNLIKFLYPLMYKDILGISYGGLCNLTKNAYSNPERVLTLKQNLSPFFMRIRKKDLELPPINENFVSVPMDDNQKEIYDFIESKFIRDFKYLGKISIKEVMNKAKLIRLRQAATNPSLLLKPLYEAFDPEDPQAISENETIFGFSDLELFEKIKHYSLQATPRKFLYILNFLTELFSDSNQKAIIWTIFVQNAYELQSYLTENDIYSSLLLGSIDQLERENTIRSFNDPHDLQTRLVIANPFSVAESISLHRGCHTAIYLERDYNCSNFIQSKDRIHRVGLPAEVITNYIYLMSEDSIDEVISTKLAEKVKRMEKIIDDDIPLFTHIDNDDSDDIITEMIKLYDKRIASV